MGWDYNGEKPLQGGGQRTLWTSEWSWKVVVMKEFSRWVVQKVHTGVVSLRAGKKAVWPSDSQQARK